MFDKKQVRDKKVTVRFTEDEKIFLEKYAAENNYKSVAEFIRELILEKVNK